MQLQQLRIVSRQVRTHLPRLRNTWISQSFSCLLRLFQTITDNLSFKDLVYSNKLYRTLLLGEVVSWSRHKMAVTYTRLLIVGFPSVQCCDTTMSRQFDQRRQTISSSRQGKFIVTIMLCITVSGIEPHQSSLI